MNIKIENIEVLGNRILIKADPAKVHEIVTAGGLVTASGREIQSRDGIQTMEDIEPPTGRVVRAGKDCRILGEGDRVLFSPYSGKKLKFMLEEYILMTEVEPVMIIKES